MHLCLGLQEILGLPEPPHFLVPGYTATVDRWIESKTQQVRTSAEIYWPVRHHQALLNAVFGTDNLVWQSAPWQDESCDPVILETHRSHFPQLWEEHDLIVRFERPQPLSSHSFAERYPTLRTPYRKTGTVKEYTTPTGLTEAYTMDWEGTSKQQIPTAAPKEQSQENTTGTSPHPYQAPSAQGYVLRLFVSGHSAATEQTLKSLHQFLENSLAHPYTLKVIDVFKHPEQAEVYQISATPTLLRVWPEPTRRLVGDLNNMEKVLQILAVPQA